jgi:hypothetical protein
MVLVDAGGYVYLFKKDIRYWANPTNDRYLNDYRKAWNYHKSDIRVYELGPTILAFWSKEDESA